MFGFDGRCPRCGGATLWQSASGWLRFPARVAFLYPLRCDHCQKRFWRFVYSPPPTARRRRGGSPARVTPAGDPTTPPPR